MKSNLETLHGKIVGNTVFDGLTLTETAYQAEQNLTEHAHPADYFCFVLQGDFTEFYERKSRACNAATLIFHPAGETHADDFHTSTRCFNIQPDVSWLSRIRQNSPVLDCPAAFRDGFLTRTATRLYKEFCHPDELSALVIEGLTLEILGETARRLMRLSSKQPPRWLAQIHELLSEQFNESFSLAQIAKTVGVHETHLAREFRRYYGTTLGEFMREKRIEFASRRLINSDASLSEIALTAGFFDQSHFARTFKLQTGLTPKQYRINFRSR